MQKKPMTEAECVRVVIRCRPMSKNEITNGHTAACEIQRRTGEIFVRKPYAEEAPKQFTFDLVYDWNCTQ